MSPYKKIVRFTSLGVSFIVVIVFIDEHLCIFFFFFRVQVEETGPVNKYGDYTEVLVSTLLK